MATISVRNAGSVRLIFTSNVRFSRSVCESWQPWLTVKRKKGSSSFQNYQVHIITSCCVDGMLKYHSEKNIKIQAHIISQTLALISFKSDRKNFGQGWASWSTSCLCASQQTNGRLVQESSSSYLAFSRNSRVHQRISKNKFQKNLAVNKKQGQLLNHVLECWGCSISHIPAADIVLLLHQP